MTMLSEMDFSCLGKFTKSPNMLAIFHLPTQFHRLLCCLGWKADPTNIEELPYLTVEFGQRGTPHRSGGEGRLGRLLRPRLSPWPVTQELAGSIYLRVRTPFPLNFFFLGQVPALPLTPFLPALTSLSSHNSLAVLLYPAHILARNPFITASYLSQCLSSLLGP